MKLDTIYNEDCLEGMKRLDDESIDLIFADPPFNVGKNYGSQSDRRDDYYEWCQEWINKCFDKLKSTGSFYLMTISRHLEKLYPMLGSRGVFINQVCWKNVSACNNKRSFWNSYQPILVYGKSENYVFNTYAQTRVRSEESLRWGKYTTEPRGQFLDYWSDIPFIYAGSIHHKEAVLIRNTNRKAHPTQMPEGLAIRAILFSTSEGDTALDPFIGSGTTAVACKKLGRYYMGFEINPEYCKIAKKRLSEVQLQFGGMR